MTEPAPTSGMAGSTQGGGGVSPYPGVPVQDPTKLTTDLVDRALSAFREVVDTRMDAMAVAIELAQTKILAQDKASRELIEAKLDSARNVADEKFAGIDSRFAERDERTAQAAQESRISLDAALAAAKEAVSEQNAANSKAIAKSEEAVAKQIDALVTLSGSQTRSIEDKISEIRSRLDRGEGQHTGGLDARALVFSLVGVLLAVAVVLSNVLG